MVRILLIRRKTQQINQSFFTTCQPSNSDKIKSNMLNINVRRSYNLIFMENVVDLSKRPEIFIL